jgi:glycosyltransferase involved in cell wall biosynthesis
MRILFVVHQYLPRHVTGTEQYVRSLTRRMQQRGHEVTIFAFEPLIEQDGAGLEWFERDELVEGIRVRRCSVHPRHAPNRELADYANPLVGEMFERWLAEQDFDVVHVFHLKNLGVDVLSAPRRRGIPTVVHLMDFWFICPNYLLLHRSGALCDGPPAGGMGCVACVDAELAAEVERSGIASRLADAAGVLAPGSNLHKSATRRAQALIARAPTLLEELCKVDCVIAPSRFLRGVFERQGFPAGRIQILPYGVEPDRVVGYAPGLRAKDDGLLHVGYIGSISRHKGVHVAIEAVQELDCDSIRLHVHGSLLGHPDYAAQMQELAAGDERIVFEGPFGPRELGDVLSRLDCVVAPSLWYENTPFSVLEALSVGLPVLASDLGGIAEVVRHEVNGLLFRPGDPSALAAAIFGLVEDRVRLDRFSVTSTAGSVTKDVSHLLQLYGDLNTGRVARSGSRA